MRDASITYPLWPPLLEGCPRTSTSSMQYPLEVAYADARGREALFMQIPLPGLGRWAPLLPPLADGLEMGEGGTPLVAVSRLAEWTGFDGTCFIKDDFGAEGYKTIAYELFLQLERRVPAAVFVPTGYGELLFGVWKGFVELQELGLSDTVPRMVACEPAARAPLAQALATRQAAAIVEATPTAAHSIGVTVNGYRGVISLQRSGGCVVTLFDAQMTAAQETLAHHGMWLELSGAASVAGLREAVAQGHRFDEPVVCLATSSGFKDLHTGRHQIPEIPPDWPSVQRTLQQRYGLTV